VLPIEEKQRLMIWLASNLRVLPGQLPLPRKIPSSRIAKWIDEDEQDLKAFLSFDKSNRA